METKLGRMEAFCSLTGVTSLTDLPDRSKLANCKNEMIESKSSKIHYQGINASSSISWGHVLQAVRNSSTGSYLIHVLCDKNCEVTSSSSFTWIQCIKRNSKLLCTYLWGDHFFQFVSLGLTVFSSECVVSYSVDCAFYGSNES